MYFESELVRIGENLPKFKIKSGSLTITLIGKIPIKPHLEPEKIFQCPECGLRFIRFTSFMKVCGQHVSEFRNVSSKKVDLRRKEHRNKRMDANMSQNVSTKMIEHPVNINPTKLPPDYFFFCKLCHSITRNYMGYRDHIKSHEDPSLRHCQVCDMEFASFATCKVHKAKLHPEISKLEIEQRKKDAKKQTDKSFVYNIIHKSKIILVPDDDLPRLKQESDQIHPKELKIVLEPICLPGFLPNNWISLPKPGTKFPWIRQKNIKSKTDTELPVLVKEEAVSDDDDDFSWPMNEESQMFYHFGTKVTTQTSFGSKRRIETTNDRSEPSLKRRAVMSGEEKIVVNIAKERKLEVSHRLQIDVLKKVVPSVKRQEDSDDDNFFSMMDSGPDDSSDDIMAKHQMKAEEIVIKPDIQNSRDNDDDFAWPMDEKIVDEESDVISQKLENVPKKPGRPPSQKIRITEPPNVPQYPGANYLFNVYDHKNTWRRKLYRIRRRLGLTNVKNNTEDYKTPARISDVTTCQICNEVRSQYSLRNHVATHYYEEAETECRICGCKEKGIRLKGHYNSAHKINIRVVLMKEQQERMEKGLENGSDYVTCSVCYTNLKTEEHLKFHKKILHEYDPARKVRPQNLTKECTICNTTYKDRKNYRGHLRKVHPELLFEGNKTIICDECGKTYNKMGFIQHFFMTHRLQQAKPKVCEKCGKTFKLAVQLTRHQCESLVSRKKSQNLVDGDGRIEICEKCGKIFKQAAQLTRHKCEDPKISRKKSQKLVHGRPEVTEAVCKAHHIITNFKAAYCHVCDKKFATTRGFKNHCRIFDLEKFVCDVDDCRAVYTSIFSYERHKKIHENGFLCKCQFCDETFNSFGTRIKHVKKIHKNESLAKT